MKATLHTIIGAIVICLQLSLWGFYSAIRLFRIISSITPKDLGLIYDDISLKLSHGEHAKNYNSVVETFFEKYL